MGGKSSKEIVDSRVKLAARSRSLNVSELKLEDLPWDVVVAVPNLVSFIADNNRLTEIPPSFCALKTLKIISFSNNRLTQVSPDAFVGMTECKELNLSCNRLPSIPLTLGMMRSLRELRLNHNAITDLPASLFEGPMAAQLRVLNLSHNKIATLPPSIAMLSMLETLNISHNVIEVLPETIAECPKLAELDVSFNKLSPKGFPAAILTRTRVVKIDVGGNESFPASNLRDLTGFEEYETRHQALVQRQFDGGIALSLRQS